MDGRPNRRTKAAFSNFSRVCGWDPTLDKVYCVSAENQSDVRVIYLHRYPICTLYSRFKFNRINVEAMPA